MSIYESLIPGNVVSFDVYPSNYLGTFNHVTVTGMVDFDTAVRNGYDPVSLHVRSAPTLPVDAPSNARSYRYIMIRNRNGDSALIGVPWIKESTLIVHTNQVADIVVADLVAGDDTRLLSILHENGYNNVSIRLR